MLALGRGNTFMAVSLGGLCWIDVASLTSHTKTGPYCSNYGVHNFGVHVFQVIFIRDKNVFILAVSLEWFRCTAK